MPYTPATFLAPRQFAGLRASVGRSTPLLFKGGAAAYSSAAIRCERLTQLLRSVVDNALRSALAGSFARARSLAANSAAGLHLRGLLGDVRALALVAFDQAAVAQ